jgi:diguanylate cyclase (GGDEF)-like protein
VKAKNNQNNSHPNILGEHYKLLSASLPLSLLISTILAVITVTVLYREIGHTSLFLWFAILCCIHIMRFIIFNKLKYSPTLEHTQIRQYLTCFRLGTLASGLTWGISGYFFSQQLDLSHQMFISFTLGGLAAGASSSLASDKLSALSFIVPTMLPNIIHFFSADQSFSTMMAIMLMLFMIYMLVTATNQGKSLYENFHLRLQANNGEAQFREILDGSPIAAAISDISMQHILFINQSYLNLLEAPFSLISNDLISTYSVEKHELKKIKQKLNDGHTVTNQLVKIVSTENKDPKWAIASFLTITYKNETSILSWLYDVTESMKMQEKIEYLAYHDPLTNLPNRSLLDDRLQLSLKTAERNNSLLCVMFIDLDGFKHINDNYGHDIGDELLKAVTKRFLDKLRLTDTLSRVGGDEFIILLPEISEINNVTEIATKILAATAAPFKVANQIINITSSIGIAVYPNHGTEGQKLFKNADLAMYHAKKLGRNNVQLYRAELNNIIDDDELMKY